MSAFTTPTTDAIIRLRDGRALGYAEVGKSDGPPIFYFHGHDSSRLEVMLWVELATTLGVRLIALDRPGIGRSDLKSGYCLWPHLLDRSRLPARKRRAPVDACAVVGG